MVSLRECSQTKLRKKKYQAGEEIITSFGDFAPNEVIGSLESETLSFPWLVSWISLLVLRAGGGRAMNAESDKGL